MKIALDENVPPHVAKALKALAGERVLARVQIVSARKYALPKAASDVPWLQKFAKSGGKVVVSGDAKMRGRLHEQKALSDAGFIVFFMARSWNQMSSHEKVAMLIRWWPIIVAKALSAKPGQFFELPNSWTAAEMKEVTPPKGLRGKPGKQSNRPKLIS